MRTGRDQENHRRQIFLIPTKNLLRTLLKNLYIPTKSRKRIESKLKLWDGVLRWRNMNVNYKWVIDFTKLSHIESSLSNLYSFSTQLVWKWKLCLIFLSSHSVTFNSDYQ